MNNDIVKHINENVLLIPEQLRTFENVSIIFSSENNGAYFKDIDGDLVGTEFYTHSALILYLETGSEELKTYDDSESATVKKGEVYYLARDMYYISDYVRDRSNLNAHLYFIDHNIISKFLETISLDSVKSSGSITKLPCDHTLKKYFELTRKMYEGTSLSKEIIELKLLELLRLIYRVDYDKSLISSLKRDFKKKDKKDIRTFMERHFLKSLAIKDFAQLCSRSLPVFNKEFKELYGLTPKKWLVERRLNYANEQLTEGKKSVTEISLEVGYENTSHFIRIYKRKFGMTPKKTRKTMSL